MHSFFLPKFSEKNMKHILALATCLLLFSCQTSEEKKEEEKIEKEVDEKIEQKVKTEKEKADSIFNHYKNKIDAVKDSVPEMP